MPIYEYKAVVEEKSCEKCRDGFDHLARISDSRLNVCPVCGNQVVRLISAPSVGASKSSFDSRAKAAGFHKLKKLGKGEYEKSY